MMNMENLFQRRLLLLWGLLTLLLPQRMEAASFVKDKQNYTAQMAGKDAISFSLPTFDYWRMSGNVYVTDGSYIEATVDGATKRIFWWKSDGSDWEDFSMASAGSSGTFTVQREQYGNAYDDVDVKVDGWSYFMLGTDMDDSDHKSM